MSKIVEPNCRQSRQQHTTTECLADRVGSDRFTNLIREHPVVCRRRYPDERQLFSLPLGLPAKNDDSVLVEVNDATTAPTLRDVHFLLVIVKRKCLANMHVRADEINIGPPGRNDLAST